MLKRKFKADFIRHMRDCDYNYRRLLKLLPAIDTREQWRYLLDDSDARLLISFNMIERSPYTNTLEISWQRENNQQLNWLPDEPVMVRLYHDAQSAEVLNDVSYRQMEAHYHYPNMQMFQHDEKLQRNCFLSSFLKHCLEFAYVADDVMVNIAPNNK